MFKKLSTIFGLILAFTAITGLFLNNTALGADSEDSTCTIFACGSNLASKLQLNIPDSDWTDTFGTDDPKKAGKDLYKKIYAITNVMPEKKAVKNTAGKYGTTESSLIKLLNNDFGPILANSPRLTQDQAINKMFEIQQQFKEEKDLLDLESDVRATVELNEIFANGNIDDSGFDLINDLDNIQNILFKKIDPIDIGGTYDISGESTPAKKETKSETPATTTSGPAYVGIVSEKIPETGTKTSVAPLEKDKNIDGKYTAKDGAISTPLSTAFNSNLCVADNNLNKSLQNFAQKKSKDSRLKETITSIADISQSSGAVKKEPGGPDDKTTAPPEFTYREPREQPVVKPAPADSWLKKLPCNDTFCLKINFVKKPVTATYQDADNCIACHIEKIDEKLKTTINHSLVPAKATGNLLEPGLCKSATFDLLGSGSAGLRFHAISKPVLTPTNDDLIYGSSIVQEWEKFTNTYKPFPFEAKKPVPLTPGEDDEDQEPPQEEIQKATVKALTESTETTKREDVLKTIQEQTKKEAAEREKAISTAETAIQSDVMAGFYQAIQRELEQMNYYFDSFQAILAGLHKKETGNEGACVLLKSKRECG